MAEKPGEDRSAIGVGFVWAARITSLGLEMVIPAVFGQWLDGFWGTSPWLLIAGAGIGIITGIIHLLKIATAGISGENR